jgi:F-type H+-transporting ATPase subunit a
MNVLGLITGAIQAYIFAILAMVYIAASTRAHHGEKPGETAREESETQKTEE